MFMAEKTLKSASQVSNSVKFPVIRTCYGGSLAKGEVRTQPSLTVPDMTMSVIDIIKRSQQGLPVIGSGKPGVFNGTIVMPDWNKLDYAERQEYIQAARDRIAFIKNRKQELIDAEEAAKRKAEIDAQVAAKLAEKGSEPVK